ncbi:hypothetical protein JWH16_04570 [Xanthomonas campestris pv. campestris]|uniref:hypothetical protein n=1 Tax=Xanthomonas campestris TaxID=339 RepID=UPI001E5765A9|nr:hypothetical protein [Xanthomonas campestris]MCD0253129.1 hypothetical protein [Xanthomonas campestris pv. campestris]
MSEQHQHPPRVVEQVSEHLKAIECLLQSREARRDLDPVLQDELHTPIAYFRQCYPDVWNRAPADPAQPPLF